MKPKKSRHESTSDDSEDSDDSLKSVSSSVSDSEDSSVAERRHKKKKKHADSSLSESGSEEHRRSKKRKHKKKKKKHGKKKRRADSGEDSASEVFSESEGEILSKKRRKHKHKHKDSKRARSDSPSVKGISDEEIESRRLHSVVKERRGSSAEGIQPSRTYYQKEYHHLAHADDYENNREREVDRFYRGSSKERQRAQQEAYEYQRQHNDRYQQDKYNKNRDRYTQNPHYNNGGGDQYHIRKPKEYDDYKRHQRYDEHPHTEEYHRKPKPDVYHQREGHEGPPRGYNNRYNQYEHRVPRGRNYDESREYRESRRGPPEQHSYHGREYPDKREKYREDTYSDRRDPRRDSRPEKSSAPPRRESVSPGEPSRDVKKDPRSERYRGAVGGGAGGAGGGGEERSRGREEERRPRPQDEERAQSGARPRDRKSRFAGEEDKQFEWGKADAKTENGTAGEKEKPNFGLSGKLTADANTVNGVVIKYTEPDDAKQPKRRWRFYPFKGDKALPILYIHRQSCFVMGRDKKVVDIHLEHPSVSKQHAALQFRATPFTRPDGSQGRRVRPYVIDLESANGTFVNNKKVEPRRYVELLERDVVKFGFSAREYVLLHENSKDDAQDDDNQEASVTVGSDVTTVDQIKLEKRSRKAAAEDGE